MLSEQLLEIISCPKDGSELTLNDSTLETKKNSYPIIKGIF